MMEWLGIALICVVLIAHIRQSGKSAADRFTLEVIKEQIGKVVDDQYKNALRLDFINLKLEALARRNEQVQELVQEQDIATKLHLVAQAKDISELHHSVTHILYPDRSSKNGQTP